MLNESQVAHCKQVLEEIRNGERKGNRAFAYYIELLLHTIRSIRINPEGTYCDWLQRSGEWRNEIEAKLEEMHKCVRYHSVSVSRWSYEYERGGIPEILNHHYYNDCLLSWNYGKGRYGDTPGEDVLIKLCFLSEEPALLWKCPVCHDVYPGVLKFCPIDGTSQEKEGIYLVLR